MAPAETAEARAGSDITFRWTEWLPSHKGPMTTWMAPYEGDIAAVNVNKLRFFKVSEGGLYPDMQWATEKMLAANGQWNATIPWDIRPGKYIIRHELLNLHFATEHSNAKNWGIVAPQFYVSCYNVKISGNGTATPPGVTFPGAYKPMDSGLLFDIYLNNPNYFMPGPALYVPKGRAPSLTPNDLKVVSPMGDPIKDAEYNKAMEEELKFFEGIGSAIYKMGG